METVINIGSIPFTPQEVESLFKEFSKTKNPQRDCTYFCLSLNTGFRVSEILSLKVGDVFDRLGNVTKFVSIQKMNMKGKKKGRSVVVSDVLRERLVEYFEHLKSINRSGMNDPLLYSKKTDKPLTFRHVIKMIKIACQKAGIDPKKNPVILVEKLSPITCTRNWVKISSKLKAH